MLELLADALRRPRFDAEQFESLRKRQIEFIKAAKDSDPSELIGTYGRAALFRGNPYGSPVTGSEHSLAAATLEDVRTYYRDQVGADRLTLVFTGDIDAAWLRKAVSEAFGGWPPAPQVAPKLHEQPIRADLFLAG
jgi:predicted Zn-dependent peptidase